MAKAKSIRELDCAADARDWAEKVLRVRIDEVVKLRDSALDFSDIEGVHDMRVATRRVRSALRDFKPLADKSRLKKVSNELKQLADALGQVRDQDVAIAALDVLRLETLNEQIKPGIEKLSVERWAERETARRHLTKVLADGNVKKLRDRFKNALEKAFAQKEAGQSISFNKAGRAAVASSLDDLLDLSTSIYQPFNKDGLHRLRVAAKRLRYAIELFVTCWGDAIAPFADEIARMQSFLGEVHDCDVWIENLGRRLTHEGERDKADAAVRSAATWLLSEFSNKRNAEYLSALALWTDWEKAEFVEKMRAIVSDST